MRWLIWDGLERFEIISLGGGLLRSGHPEEGHGHDKKLEPGKKHDHKEKHEHGVTHEHILPFHDLTGVTYFLRRFLYDAASMGAMRAALMEAASIGVLYHLDDERVIHHVGLLVLARTLRIAGKRIEPLFPVRWKEIAPPPPPPVKPPPEKKDKTWIEIALMDEEGTPIPEEAYWIQLPDGKVAEGKLDKQGRAKVKDIDEGTCKVRFPQLGGGAKPAQAQDKPPVQDWIDIHLTDDEGHPVPEARYRVELANSTVIEGVLDKEGKAHVEGVDPGGCHVSFPDLGDWDHHSSA